MRISDWSSDVCSSDLHRKETSQLDTAPHLCNRSGKPMQDDRSPVRGQALPDQVENMFCRPDTVHTQNLAARLRAQIEDFSKRLFLQFKSGRASCRERMCQYV